GQEKKRLPRQGERGHVNVFTGLLVEAEHGGGFLVHDKGKKGKPQRVLINTKGEAGHAPIKTFPYAIFETAVLQRLREISSAELASVPEPEREAARLRLRAALRRQVREIVVRIVPRGGARLLVAQCWFAEGTMHRVFLIYYKPAARYCKGGWWPLSAANLARP